VKEIEGHGSRALIAVLTEFPDDVPARERHFIWRVGQIFSNELDLVLDPHLRIGQIGFRERENSAGFEIPPAYRQDRVEFDVMQDIVAIDRVERSFLQRQPLAIGQNRRGEFSLETLLKSFQPSDRHVDRDDPFAMSRDMLADLSRPAANLEDDFAGIGADRVFDQIGPTLGPQNPRGRSGAPPAVSFPLRDFVEMVLLSSDSVWNTFWRGGTAIQ